MKISKKIQASYLHTYMSYIDTYRVLCLSCFNLATAAASLFATPLHLWPSFLLCIWLNQCHIWYHWCTLCSLQVFSSANNIFFLTIVVLTEVSFMSSPVNRIANNGFKPFEMLFKASRCDDVDLVKSFTGEFNSKLGGMVRTSISANTWISCEPTLEYMLHFVVCLTAA